MVFKPFPPPQLSTQRAKAKGKTVASVALLERIKSDGETPYQSYSTTRSIQRHGNDMDSSSSTDDDDDAWESMLMSTQFEGDAWTDE